MSIFSTAGVSRHNEVVVAVSHGGNDNSSTRDQTVLATPSSNPIRHNNVVGVGLGDVWVEASAEPTANSAASVVICTILPIAAGHSLNRT